MHKKLPSPSLSIEQQEDLLQKIRDCKLAQSKLERRVKRLESANAVIHATYENEVQLRDFQTKEKEKQYMYNRLLLDVSPSILIVLNNELRYELGSNSIFEELLNMPEQDLHGLEFERILQYNLLEQSISEIMDACRRALSEKTTVRFNCDVFFKNNSRIFTSAIVSPAIGEMGDLHGLVLLIHDVTSLALMKHQAEAASLAKANFLANMSHEMRTPLNAIVGLATLLTKTNLDSTQKLYTDNLDKASHSLLSIINDILDFSKIDAQKIEIVCNEYDLSKMISHAANLVYLRAVDKGLEFIIDLDPLLSVSYFGDEQRILQILVNLLTNAVKYTASGHITLSVHSVPGQGQRDETLVFTVKDTGIGIKEEDIPALFLAFAQMDMQKNKNVQGTGLGLAISQGLAHEMHGAITVESEYGSGSSFSLRIPQRAVGDKKMAPIPREMEPALVLGDSLSAGHLVRTLERCTINCVWCASRAEVAAFKSEGCPPRYVFYWHDFGMPLNMVADAFPEAVFVLVKNKSDLGGKHESLARHTLFLPLIVSEITQLADSSGRDSPAYNGRDACRLKFTGVRALLVDDNEVNLLVGAEILREYGIEITAASSGAEALRHAENFDYDIIFMDHMMPEMDGVETTKRLRALNEWYARAPVVALTANVLKGMREFFLENGLNAYVSKPVANGTLRAVLQEWLPEKSIADSEVSG